MHQSYVPLHDFLHDQVSLWVRIAAIYETQEDPIERKAEFDNDQNLGSW